VKLSRGFFLSQLHLPGLAGSKIYLFPPGGRPRNSQGTRTRKEPGRNRE